VGQAKSVIQDVKGRLLEDGFLNFSSPGVRGGYTAAKAPSRSAWMSAASSMPTDSRIRSAPTPAASSSAWLRLTCALSYRK